MGERQPGLVCSRDKQRGIQCLVQAAKSAAQPAAGEEIRQTAVGAQMLCYQLEDCCCFLLLPILHSSFFDQAAKLPCAPGTVGSLWVGEHLGGCAGAEMQKSSTVRTLTGPALPASSCITCCKPEQPEDCSKSHSSRGNERAESRDRTGGEGSWQVLCYFPAPLHSSALLQLEASTADLPTQHTPSLPSIPGGDAVPPLH